jgi:ABC-type dipeptide/oligopeptide/nickel transport system permease component
VFNWPGVGRLLVTSIFQRDLPVVQGVVLSLALMFALVNLFVDLIYGYVDPRIRYS